MEAASTARPSPADPAALYRLTPAILLSIYAVIPVMLGFVLIDYLLNDLNLARSLSFNGQNFLLIGLFLQVPHAFASLLTFADKEYASAYKGKLAKCVLVGLGSIALILLVGETLFALCLMAYNFYHQSAQQTGIAAIIARNKPRLHQTWHWMAIVILMVGFIAVLVTNNPKAEVIPFFRPVLFYGSLLFLAAYGLVGALVARESKTSAGRLYVAANTLMLYLYVGLYFANLPLLMIFVPVFVHDISAFAFYINHNANRNRGIKHNLFSRIRNVVPIPEIILTPAVGMLFGTIYLTDFGATFYIYLGIMLNVMHFYIEGIMWKAGSLHRKYILV